MNSPDNKPWPPRSGKLADIYVLFSFWILTAAACLAALPRTKTG